jgi:tellurite resistance protein TehA-like permease
MDRFLKKLPVRILAVNLGIVGLGLLWITVNDLLWRDVISFNIVSEGFVWLALTMCIFHLILFGLKCIRYPKEAAEIFGDQDYSAVLPMGAMGLLGIAAFLGREGFFETAVTLIWSIGVAVHILLLINFMQHPLKLQISLFSPVYIVPLVGLGLAGLTSRTTGTSDLAPAFFYWTLICSCVMWPTCLYRAHYYDDPPLNASEENLYAIFMDPPVRFHSSLSEGNLY